MGEFLGWSIFGIICLFVFVTVALIDTKQDILKSVLSFICGFLSCLLVILMILGVIYYFGLI